MFCYKCGQKIRDDAQFCQFCGAQQKAHVNAIAQANSTHMSTANGELDRDALKIYLGNILSLECLKARYEREINKLKYNINNLNNNYFKRYILRESKAGEGKLCVHFLYNGFLHVAWFNRGASYGPYCHEDLHGDRWHWAHIEKGDDILQTLKHSYQWYNFEDYDAFFLQKMAQREEARDAFFKAYAEFAEEAPLIYQSNVRNNKEIADTWQAQINGMLKELDSITRLLKQAYDVNIIPSQFRYKIYAIYYLHEFVTTSSQSLSTALLHLDLDEIKAKLDEIISQQESIIIQNAVMISQNSKLLRQNQQQLEHLQKIERHSSQAAQYAQISANYAKTCAWISTAEYIESHR